jgi:hypothetical protein
MHKTRPTTLLKAASRFVRTVGDLLPSAVRLRFTALCLLVTAFCLSPAVPARAQDDVVLRAMRDELSRSMQQLQLEKLEKPYFIAYRVQEKSGADVTASFGAVVASASVRLRFLTVEVRVGSPKLDNTNFFSMSALNRGGLAGGFGGMAQLPLEDNYKELRRQLWLATDNAYKKALEDLSRKRAALENKTSTEELPDFSEQKPATMMEALTPAKIDVSQMESLARSLSAVYRGSSNIFTDSAHVTADQTYTRYVNSEGTTFTRVNPTASVVLMAGTQAADGAPLRDVVAAYGRSLHDLPSPQELEKHAAAMAERLEKLRTADAVEHYNGPVLFLGQAAAELFGEVMAPALLAVRGPVFDAPQLEMFGAQMENPFQDRLGGRALPDFLSVADDPTLRQYREKPLLGSCRVDDDGVPTRRTVLVENGTLKTLLATRNPVTGIAHSTGNRRGGTVGPTNLIVTVSQGLSDDEMKSKLQHMIRQRELPYGMVIERLANPLTGDPEEMMTSLMGSLMPGQGGGGPTQVAVVAYKIFPDGREELVRNVALQGVGTASFKDIVAASATPFVYSTPFLSMKNSVFSAFTGGSLAEASAPLVSLVVPSLLFDDVTLKAPRKENPKMPLSPRPVGD